jgi:hypothetical protein
MSGHRSTGGERRSADGDVVDQEDRRQVGVFDSGELQLRRSALVGGKVDGPLDVPGARVGVGVVASVVPPALTLRVS